MEEPVEKDLELLERPLQRMDMELMVEELVEEELEALEDLEEQQPQQLPRH